MFSTRSRYFFSLSLSASSDRLRSVMSRATARESRCPPLVKKHPVISTGRSVPSFLRWSRSNLIFSISPFRTCTNASYPLGSASMSLLRSSNNSSFVYPSDSHAAWLISKNLPLSSLRKMASWAVSNSARYFPSDARSASSACFDSNALLIICAVVFRISISSSSHLRW